MALFTCQEERICSGKCTAIEREKEKRSRLVYLATLNRKAVLNFVANFTLSFCHSFSLLFSQSASFPPFTPQCFATANLDYQVTVCEQCAAFLLLQLLSCWVTSLTKKAHLLTEQITRHCAFLVQHIPLARLQCFNPIFTPVLSINSIVDCLFHFSFLFLLVCAQCKEHTARSLQIVCKIKSIKLD